MLASLRARAARNGRSAEAEAREILSNSLQAEAPQKQLDLGTAIRRHIAHLGGVELMLPPREPVRKPPKY